MESTKNSYEKLLRKFESDADSLIIENTEICKENWKQQKWGTSLPVFLQPKSDLWVYMCFEINTITILMGCKMTSCENVNIEPFSLGLY